MHNFRELNVWKKSRYLVKDVYQATQQFPKEEIYGLTNQIRRSAVSIPSNIAEGCGRNSDKSLAHFLSISHGSACELETQLILAADLGYLKIPSCRELVAKINEVQRMTLGFQSKLIV